MAPIQPKMADNHGYVFFFNDQLRIAEPKTKRKKLVKGPARQFQFCFSAPLCPAIHEITIFLNRRDDKSAFFCRIRRENAVKVFASGADNVKYGGRRELPMTGDFKDF